MNNEFNSSIQNHLKAKFVFDVSDEHDEVLLLYINLMEHWFKAQTVRSWQELLQDIGDIWTVLVLLLKKKQWNMFFCPVSFKSIQNINLVFKILLIHSQKHFTSEIRHT